MDLETTKIQWKLFKHKNDYNNLKDAELYGFKSTKTPPYDEQLLDFVKDLFSVINNIKFTKTTK